MNRTLRSPIWVAAACFCLASWAEASSAEELVRNGGFEDAARGWTLGGDFQADSRYDAPHSGTGYAYLAAADGDPADGLDGSLAQRIALPAAAQAATLSLAYSVDSFGGGDGDRLTVSLRDSRGEAIATLFEVTGREGRMRRQYRRFEVDVSPHLGADLELRVEASTDAVGPTVFRLDDVSLWVEPAVAPAAPPPPPPPPSPAQRALAAEMRQDWPAAAAIYRELTLAKPGDSGLWRRLADVEAAAGRPVEAAAALARAAALEPGDPHLQAEHSRAEAAAGHPEPARAAIDRALGLDPDRADYHRARAQLSNWLGDYAAAVASYTRVLELAQQDREAMLGLARTLAWQGESDAARRQVQEYLSFEPEDDAALLLLARLERWRGDYPAALAALGGTPALSEATAEQRAEAAWSLAQGGRPSRALELLSDGASAEDRSQVAAQVVALAAAHRTGAALAALAGLDPAHPETVALRRSVVTPLRSTLGATVDVYTDSDSVDRLRASIEADLSLAPEWRLGAGIDRAALDADSTSGLGAVGGASEIELRGAWLGFDWRAAPRARVAARVGHSEVSETGRTLTPYDLGLTFDVSDQFALALERTRDFHAVSPRALEAGVDDTTDRLALRWRPDLAWVVELAAARGDLSDGNEREERLLAARRAVKRTEGFMLDLGLRAATLEFDRDLDNGYYDPADYERYAFTLFAYWKLSEDRGLSLSLSPGLLQDETLEDFEFGGDVGIEWITGIFGDWQLRVRGSATENGRGVTGAFSAQSFSFQVQRRFTPTHLR